MSDSQQILADIHDAHEEIHMYTKLLRRCKRKSQGKSQDPVKTPKSLKSQKSPKLPKLPTLNKSKVLALSDADYEKMLDGIQDIIVNFVREEYIHELEQVHTNAKAVIPLEEVWIDVISESIKRTGLFAIYPNAAGKLEAQLQEDLKAITNKFNAKASHKFATKMLAVVGKETELKTVYPIITDALISDKVILPVDWIDQLLSLLNILKIRAKTFITKMRKDSKLVTFLQENPLPLKASKQGKQFWKHLKKKYSKTPSKTPSKTSSKTSVSPTKKHVWKDDKDGEVSPLFASFTSALAQLKKTKKKNKNTDINLTKDILPMLLKELEKSNYEGETWQDDVWEFVLYITGDDEDRTNYFWQNVAMPAIQEEWYRLY